MTPIEIMKVVFSKIAQQQFKCDQKFTAKQVGDIISVISLMVADPEPSRSEELYRKLITYLNLPEEIQDHMFGEILAARHALRTALIVRQTGDPTELLKELLLDSEDED